MWVYQNPMEIKLVSEQPVRWPKKTLETGTGEASGCKNTGEEVKKKPQIEKSLYPLCQEHKEGKK